jgi:alpha,alpha-trehalase
LITDNQARHVIPVELNSYLCKSSGILANFFDIQGNIRKANTYRAKMKDIMEAIDVILWNDELGSWFDYFLKNDRQRPYFHPSTIAPLWAECYS